MLVKILGCGPSVGVPMIGCNCTVCISESPYNNRTRSAIIIEDQENRILVDFGVDIRNQLIRERISNIQAVILTHDHADHVNGIDDLKIFSYYNKQPLQIYSDPKTMQAIEQRFYYMFKSPETMDYWGQQRLKSNNIMDYARMNIAGIDVQFFKQDHGIISSLGIRIGNFVYSNDLIKFPVESEQFLYNIDTWILDCNTEANFSSSHANLTHVYDWVEKYQPKQVYLTNMDHTMDYQTINRKLPANIRLAYDGLVLNI